MHMPQGPHDSAIQPDSEGSGSPCCNPQDIAQENRPHTQPRLGGLDTRIRPHTPWPSLDDQHRPEDTRAMTLHGGIVDIL